MIEVSIPVFGDLKLARLVLDFNGTLASDGILFPRVAQQLNELSHSLQIHVVTGDTYGSAHEELYGIEARVIVVPPEHQAKSKQQFAENHSPLERRIGTIRPEYLDRVSSGTPGTGRENGANSGTITTRIASTAHAMARRRARRRRILTCSCLS